MHSLDVFVLFDAEVDTRRIAYLCETVQEELKLESSYNKRWVVSRGLGRALSALCHCISDKVSVVHSCVVSLSSRGHPDFSVRIFISCWLICSPTSTLKRLYIVSVQYSSEFQWYTKYRCVWHTVKPCSNSRLHALRYVVEIHLSYKTKWHIWKWIRSWTSTDKWWIWLLGYRLWSQHCCIIVTVVIICPLYIIL